MFMEIKNGKLQIILFTKRIMEKNIFFQMLPLLIRLIRQKKLLTICLKWRNKI